MKTKLSIIFSCLIFSQIALVSQSQISVNKGQLLGTLKPKPKDAKEIGLTFGHFFIDGDVDSNIPGGYGIGLYHRRAINYIFSVRGDIFFAQTTGLDPQMWVHSTKGGGLVENSYNVYQNEDGWYPHYRNAQINLSIASIFNVGNLLFHNKNPKWNLYCAFGFGLNSYNTKLNLLNDADLPYSQLGNIKGDFDTKEGRKSIKNQIQSLYDDTFESEGPKKKGIFRLGDETNIHVFFTSSIGITRKISKRFNIGLEHQLITSDNDMLDGIRYRTNQDMTTNNDISHFTNIRLGINIGNFNKVTEPLYWLNPLDIYLNEIAELKRRPELDITDSDLDGVIDLLDEELNSLTNAKVNSKGVALDSDKDGIFDHLDKEPFSKSGLGVNNEGVAKSQCCIDSIELYKLIDKKSNSFNNNDCAKWFFPIIYFEENKSDINPEYIEQLSYVAQILIECPNINIMVSGYANEHEKNAAKTSLIQNRVSSVIDYLILKNKIDPLRLKTANTDQNQTLMIGELVKKSNQFNRKVEITLYDKE